MISRSSSLTEAALLTFRFHDDRKVIKLVRQRCPTARNTHQHSGSAGRIGWISREGFVIRRICSALFNCRHLRPSDRPPVPSEVSGATFKLS